MVHQDLGDLLDLQVLEDGKVQQDFLDKAEHQVVYMSHFAYACKMRDPLNLVLENIEYL